MKKTSKILFVLFFALITSVSGLFAQGKAKKYAKVTTFKNEVFSGYIQQNNDEKIVLETSSAVIEISKDKVKTVEYLKKKSKRKKGKKRKRNSAGSDYENIEQEFIESEKYSFDSKYAFGNTAYGLQEGQGYYHNYWIFYNDINYGITDNIAIGGGVIPLFLFAGAPSPFWLKGKFSLPIKKDMVNVAANVGIGTILGGWGIESEFPSVFTLGGVITFGPQHRNVSLDISYFGSGAGSATLVRLGGKLKISRRSYLISEITLPDSEFGFVSIGGMTIFDALALDYGLIFPVTEERGYLLAFPYLGVKIHIGEDN